MSKCWSLVQALPPTDALEHVTVRATLDRERLDDSISSSAPVVNTVLVLDVRIGEWAAA